MPLAKTTLANALADVIEQRPSSSAEAAAQWADAYVAYAQAAMTSGGSSAVGAMLGRSALVAAFTAAFNAQASQAAAGIIATGTLAYWQAMLWAGAGVGVTTVPGNFALASALAGIFADTAEESASARAERIADAFDAGAKAVVVMDTLPPLPPVVVVGPIQ